MSRTHRRVRLGVILALAALAVAACSSNAPQTTLDPQGPNARTISHLINPVFWVAGVVFVLVEGMAIIFVIKYRDRGDSQEPVQIHGNSRLEVGWTLIPAAILVAVAIPTIATIFKLSKKPAHAINVTVTAHQWWWEYNYPDLGVVTANELHMPVKQPLEITLIGADVIHSFWVPALAGKQDVVPGRVNHMNMTGDKVGTFLGQCTEFCGSSHANMRLKAMVQTPQDFQSWVASQRQAAATPTGGSPADEGLTLFTSKGCSGCHTVQGVSDGKVGPNLTHLQSRTSFAGAIFTMNPDNLSTWLKNPPGVKPGSKMPNLNLSGDEISKLVAYLETLK
ncbi:MAG TPA: cytochrome c oxidase subunit II [Acidimicrobiales bacterium]|nr:cytochrome c oxidase subunit II [Acidimicrobiales bacterium]